MRAEVFRTSSLSAGFNNRRLLLLKNIQPTSFIVKATGEGEHKIPKTTTPRKAGASVNGDLTCPGESGRATECQPAFRLDPQEKRVTRFLPVDDLLQVRGRVDCFPIRLDDHRVLRQKALYASPNCFTSVIIAPPSTTRLFFSSDERERTVIPRLSSFRALADFRRLTLFLVLFGSAASAIFFSSSRALRVTFSRSRPLAVHFQCHDIAGVVRCDIALQFVGGIDLPAVDRQDHVTVLQSGRLSRPALHRVLDNHTFGFL